MRWFGWFRKPEVEEPLRPGLCECEHGRCDHIKGKGRCTVEYPPDAGSCMIYIRDDDSDGDDPDTEPTDPVKELERLSKL